ncbi:hypothetical protein AGMMS50262_21520 [Bacteroidia bacterium]|nr:hypothetical protein AGMMS50262_21520 [Bacteroidia bacterium]
MPAKRLPDSDEERISTLKAIIEQEELNENEDNLLTIPEIHAYRNFLLTFEGTCLNFKQSMDDEIRADKSYVELFKTVQLYISHFIQVLNLAIIRGEVKVDSLAFYGLENSNEFTVPDLSTEEAIVEWGERLIQGDMERTCHGGTAIYNPAISKVKVHYDLFKDSLHSLSIYRKNTIRAQEGLADMRDKADRLIWDAWTKVEFKYWGLAPEERDRKFREYRLHFHHGRGEQLDVFG